MFGLSKRKNAGRSSTSIKKMADHIPENRRKVSGDRVVSSFEIILPNSDVFSSAQNIQCGCCVVNVRGGCFYFQNPMHEGKLSRLFPAEKIVPIKDLKLTSTENSYLTKISDIKVTFHDFRPTETAAVGLVLKFVGLNNTQTVALNSLSENYLVLDKKENWELISRFVYASTSPR